MLTIDAQVHAYERDHPGRPWAAVLTGPAQVTGDDMVAAMDRVGVDGALLVSPFTMYPYDAIKITGACTLSREAYPYKDIWDPLARIFDAFGIERCMWGTDWTRAVKLLTYEQGVDAFRNTDRLSESDKRTLMGGTLQRVYKWSPKRA